VPGVIEPAYSVTDSPENKVRISGGKIVTRYSDSKFKDAVIVFRTGLTDPKIKAADQE
jgi:hypothetical protein